MKRLQELGERFGLDAAQQRAIATLLDLVRDEHASITTIRDPEQALDVHVADSLAGLPTVTGSPTLADLGSGAGFPGLVLAIAAPGTDVTLVESVHRKAVFLRRAIEVLALPNAVVAEGRAEQLAPESFHVITARALADLPVVVEYAAPVLVDGGLLLAWKGRRTREEEADGAAAAAHLGLGAPAWRRVQPYPGVERHLVAARKIAPTPPGFPRKPGLARKRPLRA